MKTFNQNIKFRLSIKVFMRILVILGIVTIIGCQVVGKYYKHFDSAITTVSLTENQAPERYIAVSFFPMIGISFVFFSFLINKTHKMRWPRYKSLRTLILISGTIAGICIMIQSVVPLQPDFLTIRENQHQPFVLTLESRVHLQSASALFVSSLVHMISVILLMYLTRDWKQNISVFLARIGFLVMHLIGFLGSFVILFYSSSVLKRAKTLEEMKKFAETNTIIMALLQFCSLIGIIFYFGSFSADFKGAYLTVQGFEDEQKRK
ncbi:fasting-inducible integral membrane protein tm6p1-related [Anaeramoeba ignava]|uniref:Fasting-inducible integral membrane protein tm6p1-related n=1 Tax=Anaeramoeba ignava TaxID=1746090 RepID=A0A9Q0LRA0_ANAIG|nr:fasting-inducible integral membrane protein tm6p1-related [Anaeramoeba ignava]